MWRTCGTSITILSPSILWELRAQKIPVVYHLNDFKVLCASYNLVLRGEACEACKGGEFWHALKEKCYPGWGARMTLVAEAYLHKWVGTYEKCVDCFLAPSQVCARQVCRTRMGSGKVRGASPLSAGQGSERSGAADNAPLLYFGRLSAEKGVDDLLHAMQRLPDLRLIDRGRWTGARPVGATGQRAGIGQRGVCWPHAGSRTGARDCRVALHRAAVACV